MGQRFGTSTIDLEVLREFCEYKGKKVIITMMLAFVAMATAAQKKVSWKPFLKAVEFSEKYFVDTIHVKVENGAVIVPVEIAGQERHLLFDTGAEHGFWVGNQENWMKPLSIDSVKASDINGKKEKIAISQIPEIKMGGLRISNYPVHVGGHLGNYICGLFDGLIGFDLVSKGLSIKLDTKDSLLILTDRKGFFDEETKGQPTVKYWLASESYPLVNVDFPFGSANMSFDTGAIGHGIELSQQALTYWLKKGKKKQSAIEAVTVLKDTTFNASFGIFGFDTDTLIENILHLPSVQMGSLTIKDAYASTANKVKHIGSALLKHASLIIDGPKKHYVFLPHDGTSSITLNDKDAHSQNFVPSDSTGMLRAVIRKGSAAYEKGIRTGDYLIEVEGIPIDDLCTFTAIRSRKKPGEETHFVFRSPDGTEKRVVIARTE